MCQSRGRGGPRWKRIPASKVWESIYPRRAVIVRTTEGGEVLETMRIVNDVERLAAVMARSGECPEVVLVATSRSNRSDRSCCVDR